MPLCRFLPQYAIPSRKPCSISEKRRLLPRIARQTRFVDEGFVCLPAKVFRVTTSKRSLGQDCCTDTGKGSSSWVSAARAGVQREDSFITIAFFLLSATFSLRPCSLSLCGMSASLDVRVAAADLPASAPRSGAFRHLLCG